VYYRQHGFLPTMAQLEIYARSWTDGLLEMDAARPFPRGRAVVFWYHDESTFYANDRRDLRWVHESETATPQPKGEGASLMVADFVSADYGWLRSPDGLESARILFRAGVRREGYFENKNIVEHAQLAMDILRRHYPNEDHVLIFDNASTHTKRADNALSARHMSKKPTHPRFQMWGVDVNAIGADGKPVHGTDGKVLKQRVCMSEARLADGSSQPLYFDPQDGTGRTCVFKGMDRILAERGIDTRHLKAECPDFKCIPEAQNCCTRRVLWNQSDFIEVKSVLEIECEARGFAVVFLPKFHCELNPIERCWCHAKRLYRLNAPSSAEADLEANVVRALDDVPIEKIRKLCSFLLRAPHFR
jgi:transposase